jgi:hypothetical protein
LRKSRKGTKEQFVKTKIVLLCGLTVIISGCFSSRQPDREAANTSSKNIVASSGGASAPGGGSSSQGASIEPAPLRDLMPVGDRALNDVETQQLKTIFEAASTAANSITPSANAPLQRKAIDSEVEIELGTFLGQYTNSAWGPSVHIMLARRAQMRCSYAQAMDQYWQAWEAVRGSTDASAQQIAWQATAGLAKLLALTGRLPELDALEADVRQLSQPERPEANGVGLWKCADGRERIRPSLTSVDCTVLISWAA